LFYMWQGEKHISHVLVTWNDREIHPVNQKSSTMMVNTIIFHLHMKFQSKSMQTRLQFVNFICMEKNDMMSHNQPEVRRRGQTPGGQNFCIIHLCLCNQSIKHHFLVKKTSVIDRAKNVWF